jgi:hypothetical protein
MFSNRKYTFREVRTYLMPFLFKFTSGCLSLAKWLTLGCIAIEISLAKDYKEYFSLYGKNLAISMFIAVAIAFILGCWNIYRLMLHIELAEIQEINTQEPSEKLYELMAEIERRGLDDRFDELGHHYNPKQLVQNTISKVWPLLLQFIILAIISLIFFCHSLMQQINT